MSVDTENLSTGFVQNFKPNLLLEKAIAKETQQIKPVEKRQEEVTLQSQTVDKVIETLETVKTNTSELVSRNFWGKKTFTSSDEAVITGSASNAAEPGQHYVRVDKIALSHQISSQSFKSKDVLVGQGDFKIKIGESVEQVVAVGPETTLEEFVADINASDADIKASIIKTNESDKPFQVILSSGILGEKGQIHVDGQLEAKGKNEVIPDFLSSYTNTSEWLYNRVEEDPKPINEEAVSNSAPKILQKYNGSGYDLLFTVVNTGRVGESDALELKWEDQENPQNNGIIKLDRFNYSAGKPVEVAKGLVLEFSPGDLLVHDTFSINSDDSDAVSPWSKKLQDVGSPKIGGEYTGEDDVEYMLKVVQGGTIGKSESVLVEYYIEDEKKGDFDLGKDYVPGSKIDIGFGLDFSIEDGILVSGYESTFDVEPPVDRKQWWRFATGGDDNLPQKVSIDVNWSAPDNKSATPQSGLYQERSTANKKVIGEYTGNFDNTYTFTVEGKGSVGITDGTKIKWSDSFDNTGEFDVGADYVPGAVLPFADGLSLVFDDGLLFEADYFTVNAFSPVVRAAQDAEIRLGASRDDDGVFIKHSSNELTDVIKGVTLNLQAPSDETVLITIDHDYESVLNQVKAFVENTNAALALLKESTKYDVETKEAAPLQAQSSVINIYRRMTSGLIDPITGLPVQENTLVSFGIELNKVGQLELDEEKLSKRLKNDYDAVANIFRSYGNSTNDAITYLGSNQETQISGLEGYKIDVTTAAEEGKFESRVITKPISVDETNNSFRIIINDRESEDITIDAGTYNMDEFIEKLQIEIEKDPIIAKIDHVIFSQEGKFIIKSDRFGNESNVRIKNQSERLLRVFRGKSIDGIDAQGNIDGLKLEGTGRLLTAPEETKYEGLRLYSSVSNSQIKRNENTAEMIVTKGVAQKINDYIENQLKDKSGSVDILSEGLKERLTNIDDQIRRFNTRIEDKRQFLAEKLARSEAKIGSLQQEGRYISSQLAQLK